MNVPPVYFGNPDPDWQPARAVNIQGRQIQGANAGAGAGGANGAQPPMALLEVEMYPNPAPRKCIWAMLLLSSLLVLRVQQDRYAEAVRWHGGVPDEGPPFPWEVQALVGRNDSYEATFLAPTMRRASTFVQPPVAGASMVLTGLGQSIAVGAPPLPPDPPEGAGAASGVPGTAAASAPGLAALVAGDVAKHMPRLCASSKGGEPCYVGVQRIERPAATADEAGSDAAPAGSASESPVTCHRFVGGAALSSLTPLASEAAGAGNGGGHGVGCIGTTHLSAAVLTGRNNTVVLAWEPMETAGDAKRLRAGEGPRRPSTCLAAVDVPSMRPTGAALTLDLASTVLYDPGTASIITVGFSGNAHGNAAIIIHRVDSVTLRPQWRYRLPVGVAWLLHASRSAEGYLVFVGSEQPFVGTMFVVDLKKSEVLEQDPPPMVGSNRRKPRRRKLPRTMFVESLAGELPPSRQKLEPGPCGPVLPG